MDTFNDKQKSYGPRGWRNSLGFYLAVLCSSFGLVNLWRFPYVTIENGGGAFLYLYFFLTALLGSAFVMSELLIGKIAQRGLWVSIETWYSERQALLPKTNFVKRFFYKILSQVGIATTLATFLVMAYYTVISGWILSSLLQIILSNLGLKAEVFQDMDTRFFIQWLAVIIHLGICYVYIQKDLRRSIERLASIVTPLFLVLLIILCIQVLELPQSEKVLRFLLYPDFSKINWASLHQAIGHMVLSLGLGLGTLITFGSYFHPHRDVTTSGPQIVMFSMLASGLAVLIICPMVVGASFAVFGPRLVFQTVPQFILGFPEGKYFLFTFYGSLYLSSLVASTSVLESLVGNISDRWNWTRSRSLLWSSLVIILLCFLPIASSTWWRHYRWMGGVSLLETIDGLLVNYLLPLVALGLSLVVIFLAPKKMVQREFISKEIIHQSENLFPLWKFVVLALAPTVIILSFVFRVLAAIG